ncbi:hypothetical protein LTS18_004251 [Coniosporium uncinatum]|uniref:Uncharacterized protein n=1 Tax=Coniosporium uncinatum TaxID=93489 RepID=A0ACC3DZN9_9PEZI|nr:hypothetical protein LTS18_004251 [Coniosporium uncinatum]
MTTSAPQNRAAWLKHPKQTPFEIGDAPTPTPSATEILIRIHAIAINPIEAAQQKVGMLISSYPFIIGCDAAGEVVEVGSSVTKFQKGDRVTMLCDGSTENDSSHSAFQLYAASREVIAAKIPDGMAYKDAVVLPLGISTAACMLFQQDTLALPFPTVPRKANGKVLLVWGGSSSVGATGIQLAIGAGYDVVTTASPRNHAMCKEIGAKWVFDHSSPTVVEDIVSAVKSSGQLYAGAFCAIFGEPNAVCGKVTLQLATMDEAKVVATVYPAVMPLPKGLPEGVKYSTCYGSDLKKNEVGPAVWGEWIPKALENGDLKCKPDAVVVGHGLESLQEACDKMSAGVSGAKLVVELS